jgi:hypothetical protein
VKCDKYGCPERATRRGILAGSTRFDEPTVVVLCDGHASRYEKERLLEHQWTRDETGARWFYTEAV